MMELFYSAASPFVRKVMVILHETDQLDAVTCVPTSGTPLSPAEGFEAQNPLGKIPALARPDGPTLYDSRVICQFLDARASAGLYGTGAAYWDMLTLEATGDGIAEAALLITYEARLRPEEKQFASYTDGQWAKITQTTAALEAKWMAHLNGSLSIGQISVACALGYLDLRHDARGWRKTAPELAAWYAKFSERGAMVATAPPK
jgi:glutathione S-transferase